MLSILALVSGFFKNLNPKFIIAICIVIAVLMGGWAIKYKFDKQAEAIVAAQQEKEFLIKKNMQLDLDLQTAVKTNNENKSVIDRLTQDNLDATRHVRELANAQKADQATIQTIRQKILQAKPSDDGPVAKVLADTIEQIQADREARK